MNSIENNNNEEQEIENENEKAKLRELNTKENYNKRINIKNRRKNSYKSFLLSFVIIFLFYLIFKFCLIKLNIIYNYNNKNLKISIEENNKITLKKNIINDGKNIRKNNNLTNNIENYLSNNNTNIINKKKIGLAFIYSTLYSNGIARFITLTANYFMKTGKYDICFITSKPNVKEYTYNSSIKRFIGENNYTLIRNITKYENIDIFILQNTLSQPIINFYKSLGKKVIGVFHGVFLSPITHGNVIGYKNWINFDLFDSYIFISADDYYFYKKLGFKNEIYMPNLYTFEPSKTKNSNLTYNNIIMLGRQNDPVKGAKYAVKAMSIIIKEVPDARLTLITSDSRIQFLKDLIKELNLTNNVFIHYHTYNISSFFLNSSLQMYTSLSEAFPMAMNEGKAHGLPIVAFDVPYSPPYQDGVIVVDQLDYEALARETILLLKDYDYRKKMGIKAKESLNKYSNEETVNLWERLFLSLLSEDINDYRKLQQEIETKYYNEEYAKFHMEKHFNAMLRVFKNLTCHKLNNFINITYIQNIQNCNITDNNITRNR